GCNPLPGSEMGDSGPSDDSLHAGIPRSGKRCATALPNLTGWCHLPTMTPRMPKSLPLLLALAAAPVAAGAQPAPIRVYVPNQMGASISVLDGEGRLVETVDLRALGFSA